MKKLLLNLLLLLLTSTTAWADTEKLGGYEFTIGTDKEGTYYKVDTKEALAAIATYVNANKDNTCEGKRFKQTIDITLSKTWTPIGGKEYNFKGTYDGGVFNIHGLSADKDEYNGLFGYVGIMGIVKNVNVVNCSISGIKNVGGIVGRNNGTIDNCTVSGTISVKESEGINWFGGICGFSLGTIKNCISTATLNNTTSASCKYFGGITGYNSGKILDCYAVGSINITASDSTRIGVVAGYNSSNGTISGTYYYAGNSGYEAVGKNNNTTEGSIEITPIQATDIDGLTYVDTGINVAGKTPCLSGYFAIADEQDLIDFANYVNASSANTCEGLTFKMTADLDFSNMPNISKFDDGNFFPIGYNYGSDCYFNGHFDGQGHTITGLRFNNYNNQIGLFFSVGSANAMVENVHLVSPTFSGRNIVGGIVAYLYAGTVRNCSVVGGSIRGYEYVGGIVGLSDYDTKSNCVKTVSGCKVIATTLLSDNGKLGTIVGGNTNDADATDALTISNCTYHTPADLDICGAGDGDRYTDGGGNQRVYQAALGTGVTASNPIYSYGSNYYFESGATVSLSHNRPGYVFGGYASSDVAITNGTFTMPANDVTVTATFTKLAVSYIDADGKTQYCTDYIVLTGSETSLDAGWYVATGTVSYTGTISLNGDVHLILADDCTMHFGTEGDRNSSTGIGSNNDGTLTIYGQSAGGGALSVYTKENLAHGIYVKFLTINGGHVTVNTTGTGANALRATDDITINGGTVSLTTAKSFTHAIFAQKGNFYYNGGDVCATANDNQAYAIKANGNYYFSWRNAADRITIGSTGLYVDDTNTATFSRLFKDETGNYYGGTLTGKEALATLAGKTLCGTTNLVLADDEDNTGRLSSASAVAEELTVTYKRSFTEKTPATVCLPFDYTPDDTDGRFYYFVGITKEDGQYVATMKENTVKELTANTPYLFMPAATGEVDFSGDYTIKESKDAPSTTSGDWTFLGTYDEVKWDEAPTGIYGFSAQAVDDQGISQGEFVKVGAKVKIRPFRAYLEYKNGNENYSGARALTRGDADELPASIMVRLIGSNGNTTAIGTVDTQTGEVNIDRDGWYTLSGRRLPNKPTQRGIYINNGNKVIIK